MSDTKKPKVNVVEVLQSVAPDLQDPLSLQIEIGKLSTLMEIDDLTLAFDVLISVLERCAKHRTDQVLVVQTAALDLVEFLSVNGDKLCVEDREKLVPLRGLVTRTGSCLKGLCDVIDKRMLLPFLENRYGDQNPNTMVAHVGGLSSPRASHQSDKVFGSPYNKLKGKIFRAVDIDWSDREQMIQDLLRNVDDKRRVVMEKGCPESRGYTDMSDDELKGWSIFYQETYLAPPPRTEKSNPGA